MRRRRSPHDAKTASLSVFLFVAQSLLFLGLGQTGDANQCATDYDTSVCDVDTPYLCHARLAARGWCSSASCCCISPDETFASPCLNGDICCHGRCCDGELDFCCGKKCCKKDRGLCCDGHCCDADEEVCCGDKCTAKATPGLRIALPVVLAILIVAYYVGVLFRADAQNRPALLALGVPVVVVLGLVHIIVAVSAWDCSGSIKAVLATGIVYLVGGLIVSAALMLRGRKAGVGIFSAFAVERVVYVYVLCETDQRGNIRNVAIATTEQVRQAQTQLAAAQA